MGSSPSFDQRRCPSGQPCLTLYEFQKDLLNSFRGDYKQVAAGFHYDLWGKKNKTEQLCTDVFGDRSCGYAIKFSNPWREWQSNVEDPTYESSVYEKHASWRYSDLAMGHYLETNGADTGVCMISNLYGTVCLLRNAGDTDMDTYRIWRNRWSNIVSGSPSEIDVATPSRTAQALR